MRLLKVMPSSHHHCHHHRRRRRRCGRGRFIRTIIILHIGRGGAGKGRQLAPTRPPKP